MTLYDILNIPPCATNKEIKKAYYKLSKVYHPDINNNSPESNKKFIEIKSAYEILSDPIKREQYDMMTNKDKIELYDALKLLFSRSAPQYINKYRGFLKEYDINESLIKSNINNMKFSSIWQHIYKQYIDHETQKIKPLSLDIYGNINCTLEDKYNDRVKSIVIHRQFGPPSTYYVPLRDDNIIFENEGEIWDNEKGNVIIQNIMKPHQDYIVLPDNNLIHVEKISLIEYIKGSKRSITYLDDEILTYEWGSLMDKTPLITIPQKGLPTGIIDDDEKLMRGSLFIQFEVDNLDKYCELLEKQE